MRFNLNSFHVQQLKILTFKIIFLIFVLTAAIYFLLDREVESIDILNVVKPQPVGLIPVENDNNIMDLKYRPWKNDTECNKYFIEFIRARKHPKMALASYPGSGNTWMRGIIERMTGYFTGSVYADKNLFVKGFYGEMMPLDCGCTVVQKTHEHFNDWASAKKDFDGRVIFIIRNPYDTIVSCWKYLITADHLKHIPDAYFFGDGWNRFVVQQTKRWMDFALCRIPHIKEGGVLFYENLVRDRSNQFRKLMSFLNLPVDEQRLKCTLKHDYKAFKRTHAGKSQRSLYTREQRMAIDKAIANVQKFLKLMKQDPIPLHHYLMYNTSAVADMASLRNHSCLMEEYE